MGRRRKEALLYGPQFVAAVTLIVAGSIPGHTHHWRQLYLSGAPPHVVILILSIYTTLNVYSLVSSSLAHADDR